MQVRATLVTGAVLAAVLVGGCGSSHDGTTTAGSTAATTKAATALTPNSSGVCGATSGTPAASLPESVKSSGEVTVAMDATFPPFESVDVSSKKLVGVDPELACALGAELGVKVKLVNTAFDGIIPALATGRYDMSISAATDTEERQKQVDFVDYITGGSQLLVQGGNPNNVGTLDTLCGGTLGVAKGTSQIPLAEAASAQCEKSGKKPINLLPFPDSSQVELQLRTGRVPVVFLGSVIANLIAQKSGGKIEVLPNIYDSGNSGITFAKNNPQLRDAVQRALQRLMDNGTYDGILQKFNVRVVALKEATINQTKPS